MLDFTGVAAIAIPEGNVVKIENAAGILWEKPSSGGLPAGWSPAAYVQFTGKQQIDTGIVPTQNTKIEVTFTRESTSSLYMYGVRNSGNTASVTAYLASSGAWRFGNTYRNFTISQNEEHTAVVSSENILMDEGKYNYGASVKSFTGNATLTLGASRGTSGALGSPQFVGKIKAFKMYSGDDLVLDLQPVVNGQGVYALWDSVSGVVMESMTTTPLQGGNL